MGASAALRVKRCERRAGLPEGWRESACSALDKRRRAEFLLCAWARSCSSCARPLALEAACLPMLFASAFSDAFRCSNVLSRCCRLLPTARISLPISLTTRSSSAWAASI